MYKCVKCEKEYQSKDDLIEYLGGQLVCKKCDAELDRSIEGDFKFAKHITAEERKQTNYAISWRLWKERRQISDVIQEEKFRDLLQRLPIVEESTVLEKWKTIDPEHILDGITDTGDSSWEKSRRISHLLKVYGVASVIEKAQGNTSVNNGSFSELVDHAELQQVREITAIIAQHRWSQGQSINDLSVKVFGVPGWGVNTFLVCRIGDDTYLCYDAEGVANERTTILTDKKREKAENKALKPERQKASIQDNPEALDVDSQIVTPSYTADQRPKSGNNTLAIISMVAGIAALLGSCLGIIGILLGVISFITGAIAGKQIKDSDGAQEGERMASIGRILGGASVLLGIVVSLVYLMIILLSQ